MLIAILKAFISQAIGAFVLFLVLWLICRQFPIIGSKCRYYEKWLLNKIRKPPEMVYHKGKMVDKRDLEGK